MCERRRARWGLQSPPNQAVSQGVLTVCSTDGEQQTNRRGLGLGGAQFPTPCRTLSSHQPQLTLTFCHLCQKLLGPRRLPS